MLSAKRAFRGSKNNGVEMPRVEALAEFYEQGYKFRAGQIAMLFGRPGSQKSGLAMWLVAQWGLPTLYVSGDMSQFTASTRVASIHSGRTTEELTEMQYGDDSALIDEALAQSSVEFLFNTMPSLDDIDAEVDAWVERFDAYPAVIVIDNLIDVEPVSEDELASLKAILQELKDLARRTNAFVLSVHHSKEEGDTNMPPAARLVQSKVNQTPELILGIALDVSGIFPVLRIAVVKNRSGPSSPDAKKYIELNADPARTWFGLRS